MDFTNTVSYTSFRFDVTSTGGQSTQFSELQLIGETIPEPTTGLLTLLSAIGFLGFRRR